MQVLGGNCGGCGEGAVLLWVVCASMGSCSCVGAYLLSFTSAACLEVAFFFECVVPLFLWLGRSACVSCRNEQRNLFLI